MQNFTRLCSCMINNVILKISNKKPQKYYFTIDHRNQQTVSASTVTVKSRAEVPGKKVSTQTVRNKSTKNSTRKVEWKLYKYLDISALQ